MIQLEQCILSFMGSPVFESLFPRFCIGCGYVGTYICPICEERMKKIKKPVCFYCNRPSILGLTHPRCHQENGVDGHLSLYLYDGLFKRLLLESKYKGAYLILMSLLSFSQPYLLLNLQKWSHLFNPTMMSVPLHIRRIRERGFNQSDFIVKTYSKYAGIATGTFLERVVNTGHLATIISKNKRKHHIQGAFKYIGGHPPQTALLVDDVITSGSTVLECSRTLKENGVRTVLTFSLAKG